MSAAPAPFVWYELMTTDATAAEAFYREVVGWSARDASRPGMTYTILQVGEVGVAGLMTLPEPARAAGTPPGWVGYVAVDDVDAYAARVTAAGGVVHRAPADIPDVGRFAMVADPQGAVFVLFTPNPQMQSAPPPPAGAQGTIGWRELMTTDLKHGFGFYTALFGWTDAGAVDMGGDGPYQMFAAGDRPIGGMMTKPARIEAPSFWSYYIQVDGLKAAVARAEAGGGKLLNGPMQVPGDQWIAQGLDPQGALFCLLSNDA